MLAPLLRQVSILNVILSFQNGNLPLLIPTPNGRDEAGTSRDCYLLNSTLSSQHHMNTFRYFSYKLQPHQN